VATALYAKAEKAYGTFAKTQGGVPKTPVPTGRSSSIFDQPDFTGLGELLCGWEFESVLQLRSRLGRKEDTATFNAIPKAKGLRLAAVE
jgi:hypothetical protein